MSGKERKIGLRDRGRSVASIRTLDLCRGLSSRLSATHAVCRVRVGMFLFLLLSGYRINQEGEVVVEGRNQRRRVNMIG